MDCLFVINCFYRRWADRFDFHFATHYSNNLDSKICCCLHLDFPVRSPADAFILGTCKLWVKVPESMCFEFTGKFPEHVMAKDVILNVIGDIGVDGATYRAMEWRGDAIMSLSMEERMTLCNMAIEAGGKNGIIEADDVTMDYVRKRTDAPYKIYKSDDDAGYFFKKKYNASEMEPHVAKPQ